GQGAGFLDAPVGGSVNPAREGKLLIIVGGDADDFARAKPVLQDLGRRVEYCGPTGGGSIMKLAVNLPLLVYWQSLAEAMVLGEAAGVDPARTLDILRDTSGANRVVEQRIPNILKGVAGEEIPSPNTSVSAGAKDTQMMIDTLRSLGANAPVVEAAGRCFDACAAAGYGEADGTMAIAWHFLENSRKRNK
ncbi:MAG: NAD(P)-dependent oxidoreductase, partial [Alphaproteobacteria bacterium]|nr:NAD(P)-dependent oxidoreductase [Alphaproteobacteria bacterium]